MSYINFWQRWLISHWLIYIFFEETMAKPENREDLEENLDEDWVVDVSNWYNPSLSTPLSNTFLVVLSFTKQKPEWNSTTTSLSLVSLEILIKFLTIWGTWSIALSHNFWPVLALKVSLPIWRIASLLPFPTVTVSLPPYYVFWLMLEASEVIWLLAPLSANHASLSKISGVARKAFAPVFGCCWLRLGSEPM